MLIIDGEAFAEKMRGYAQKLREDHPDSIIAPIAAMSYDVAAEEALTAPSIDAAPVVHGYWEPSVTYPEYLVCSNCRDAYVDPVWLSERKWGYCPSCGAKMDEGERADASTCGPDYCEIGGDTDG